jgi:hypothetical protein
MKLRQPVDSFRARALFASCCLKAVGPVDSEITLKDSEWLCIRPERVTDH